MAKPQVTISKTPTLGSSIGDILEFVFFYAIYLALASSAICKIAEVLHTYWEAVPLFSMGNSATLAAGTALVVFFIVWVTKNIDS